MAETPAEEEQPQSTLRWLIETALLVALAFALAQGIKTFVVQPFVIPSGSMLPTIQLGERVIAEKLTYRFSHDPRAGEIVVFANPEGFPPILIKRVIAVGGQTVDLKDGAVYVDGRRLDEPYTYGKPSDPLNPQITYPFKVPEGYVWVMGDNRTNSGDSRQIGPIAVAAVKGRAVWSYWPVKEFGPVE
jgi:signal peptidase I